MQLLRRWFQTRQKLQQSLDDLRQDVDLHRAQIAALRASEAAREAATTDSIEKLMKVYKRMQTRAAADGELEEKPGQLDPVSALVLKRRELKRRANGVR